MSVHRTSANRELPSSPALRRGVARTAPRKADKGGLALSIAGYFGAICVIGWFVITFGDGSGDVSAAASQVKSSPAPAPTVAPTVASQSYFEGDDGFVMGEGAQTADFWASRADQAIPPSQDPLTRQHY